MGLLVRSSGPVRNARGEMGERSSLGWVCWVHLPSHWDKLLVEVLVSIFHFISSPAMIAATHPLSWMSTSTNFHEPGGFPLTRTPLEHRPETPKNWYQCLPRPLIALRYEQLQLRGLIRSGIWADAAFPWIPLTHFHFDSCRTFLTGREFRI